MLSNSIWQAHKKQTHKNRTYTSHGMHLNIGSAKDTYIMRCIGDCASVCRKPESVVAIFVSQSETEWS